VFVSIPADLLYAHYVYILSTTTGMLARNNPYVYNTYFIADKME